MNFPAALPIPVLFERHLTEHLKPLLRQVQSEGKLPPALLFSGPKGFGKRRLAYWFAQWLFCTGPRTLENACGKCRFCLLASKSHLGSWVDFQEIAAEEDKESRSGGTLKIEDFRDLKNKQGFGAHEAPYRIFLIRDAEKMTPSAGNSLLKLVEEPPSGWVFIFTTNDETTILPTLLSRCQRIRLRPCSNELLEKFILENSALHPKDGHPKTESEQSVEGTAGTVGAVGTLGAKGTPNSLTTKANKKAESYFLNKSQGSFEKLLTLLQQRSGVAQADISFSPVSRFLNSPQDHFHSLLEWATQSAQNFSIFLDEFELYTHETLCSGASSENIKNKNSRDILISETFQDKLGTCRIQSALPLNRKLVVQDLLFSFIGQL